MSRQQDSSINEQNTDSSPTPDETTDSLPTSEHKSDEISLDSEDVMKAALKFANQLQEAYTREFVFLLVGRTGVGKSSTINQLMGNEVAPVGDYEPTTMSVENYKLPVANVNFVVFDTPGLCDDLPNKGNDKSYIKKMKETIKYVDCMLYVTPLSDTRVRADEKYGIELITKAFGEKIWSNSVIVFTFADYVKPDKYHYTLSTRTRLIREAIQKDVSSEITDKVPSVAIDNTSQTTPDGKQWLGELYTTVIERISSDGFVQYIMATAPMLLEPEPKIVERIVERPIYIDRTVYIDRHLDDGHKKRVKETIEEKVPKQVAKTGWQIFTERVSSAVDGLTSAAKKGFETVKGWFGIK
jgi:small GTP-binding protein